MLLYICEGAWVDGAAEKLCEGAWAVEPASSEKCEGGGGW